jgi:hypothetical protein
MAALGATGTGSKRPGLSRISCSQWKGTEESIATGQPRSRPRSSIRRSYRRRAGPSRSRRCDALVEAGLEAAQPEGFRIVAVCPFVKAFLRKHPEPVEIG